MDVAAEPVFTEGMFERITNQLLGYIDFAADLPLDGLFLGDDWGGQDGVLLGPDTWRRYIKPSWRKIIEAAHRHGLPVFNHCCGSVAAIMPDVTEIGLDCLESVQPEAAGNDPYFFKREYGNDITFWGGLGSQSIIPFGTPKELATEIGRLIREMGSGGGYILSTAKGLMPDTPAENAAAIVESFVDQSFQ
jgi:uroporphyrinogen decarboxylase